MAIFGFVIGALLVAGGLGSLLMAVNLVPTEMGLTYALSGVILIGCGGVALVVAALIARIDRITAPRPAPAEATPPTVEPQPQPPTEAEAPEPVAVADDEEVNLNRAGHLPSLQSVEKALAEPEAGPHIVGRYSAGGAKYAIYSDGSIEAETGEGGFRFASMEEFKAYIANRNA